MSFEAGRIPGRTYKGTGPRAVDITFLGLSASPAIDLPKVLHVEWTKGDNTCYVDWAASTNVSLHLEADVGTTWEALVAGQDHHGITAEV